MFTMIALLACAVTYYVSSRWFKSINDALNRNEVDKTNGWALSIFGIVNVIPMCLVIGTFQYDVSGSTEGFKAVLILLVSIVFSVSITWVWKIYQERKKR